MLEVTREATTCGIVQFEVESTGTEAFGPGPVSHDMDNDESEDVCLLVSIVISRVGRFWCGKCPH